MARVKGGTTANKRRKNILSMTKGYRHAPRHKKRAAKEAIFHAGRYAFAHRRDKKNDFRKLWNVRINGALDSAGSTVSYSKLMGGLKKQGILINRKMLAELAAKSPSTFERIVKKVG